MSHSVSRSRLGAAFANALRAYRSFWSFVLRCSLGARHPSDGKRDGGGTKYHSKFHARGYLSHHLAAISMAAVYTDAAHIADGVIGLKQRSLAASDPTE